MRYESKIKISKEKAEELQVLLDKDSINFEKEDIEEDSVLFKGVAVFDNGFMAHIKVCSGQNNLYVDPVLFDNEGNEVYAGEPAFELLGEYYFEYKGNAYVVYVEEEWNKKDTGRI